MVSLSVSARPRSTWSLCGQVSKKIRSLFVLGEADMFVGHYGVSFAAKRVEQTLPLWLLFLAVQVVDVFWAVFVLLGVEKVRIVPGITASNPFPPLPNEFGGQYLGLRFAFYYNPDKSDLQ
jgi:hypothetical protein